MLVDEFVFAANYVFFSSRGVDGLDTYGLWLGHLWLGQIFLLGKAND